MIVIIDYDAGNVGSVQNMLRKLGYPATVSRNPEEVAQADKMILPGVGSFDFGMDNLHSTGLVDLMSQRVLQDKIPILGICLGSQLMLEGSEEGEKPGLGWIKGFCKKFVFENELSHMKIPHMGWNEIQQKKDSPIFKDFHEDPSFYFVHSYFEYCLNREDVSATARYGIEFDCAFEKENIFGVQFHPEKSHKFGMKLLSLFASL